DTGGERRAQAEIVPAGVAEVGAGVDHLARTLRLRVLLVDRLVAPVVDDDHGVRLRNASKRGEAGACLGGAIPVENDDRDTRAGIVGALHRALPYRGQRKDSSTTRTAIAMAIAAFHTSVAARRST